MEENNNTTEHAPVDVASTNVVPNEIPTEVVPTEAPPHSGEEYSTADEEDFDEESVNDSIDEEEFEADERSVHCLSRDCIKKIGERANNRHFIVMQDGLPIHVSDSIHNAFSEYEKVFLEVVLDELSSNRIILDHHLDTMECIFRTDVAVENRFLIISYPRHITTFELYMV